MRVPDHQRGFSLIEVLVAVAIVAIALAAGSRAAGSLLNSAERLSDVTAAQWCVDNRLANIKLDKVYPDIGESTFECVELSQPYRGVLRVRGNSFPDFRTIEVAVARADGTPLYTVTTVLGRY